MDFGKNGLVCLLAVLFNCLLTGCRGKERSEIEIIKYDPKLVQEIMSHFDSTYTGYPKRHDYWWIKLLGRQFTTLKMEGSDRQDNGTMSGKSGSGKITTKGGI